MAGARIELDTNLKSVADALTSAEDALSDEGLPLLLADIGEYLLRATRERAALEVSPDGEPWAALSPRYATRKARERPGLPMLRFDGHMLGDRLVWQLGDDGNAVYVGTSAPYGALQQFGGTIQHAARSQTLYFKASGDEVSPQFVTRKKANFAQDVNVPAHDATIPARPWLGLSAADEAQLTELTLDHLQAAIVTKN